MACIQHLVSQCTALQSDAVVPLICERKKLNASPRRVLSEAARTGTAVDEDMMRRTWAQVTKSYRGGT